MGSVGRSGISLLSCFMLLVGVSQQSAATEGARPFHVYNPGLSPARNWNEVLLSSISRDYARPTVHARNLFHAGVVIYDTWAFFDDGADAYILGRSRTAGIDCSIDTASVAALKQAAQADIETARLTATSYAMYRFIQNRFRLLDLDGQLIQEAPGYAQIFTGINAAMDALGLDKKFVSIDVSTGSAAALGNLMARCIHDFGLSDGANELQAYANTGYLPVNPAFNPAEPGVGNIVDANRWQPLELDISIDQAGNVTAAPPFLGANWGQVEAFSLAEGTKVVHQRDGVDYPVYLDPGAPPRLDDGTDSYKWNHLKVMAWSSHLDENDGVTVDISPATVGNLEWLPDTTDDYRSFYLDSGAVLGAGYEVNPKTGKPYQPQIVPRGDYTRVLAEFWADGPDSLTPPGHWFRLLNEAVLDHPDFEPRYEGVGPVLTRHEWEAKAYFLLGATMHDVAIAAWGAKGWYDFARPVTAIRYMAEMGQSSDPALPNYHPDGVFLQTGSIELVEEGDSLAGARGENVGKIKVYAWRGPDFIQFGSDNSGSQSPTNSAGVGWILAQNWWPYQRPTFVTPPFAGYVSGHSTYSRAAAEVLTSITGDPYFPGGVGEFTARAQEFLVFEKGPSVDIKLQWATYRDASDQCSLSRIWGGIHPPVDDIPGRKLGIEISRLTIAKASAYFTGDSETLDEVAVPPKRRKKGGAISALWLFALMLTIGSGTIRRVWADASR